LINVPLFGLAIWYGYGIMRIAGRGPWGWVLIYTAIGVAFVQGLYRVGIALTMAGSAASSDYYYQVVTGYPVIILLTAGTYLLYRRFQKHIKEMQRVVGEHEPAASGEPATPSQPS
jgi:hypothetical protein